MSDCHSGRQFVGIDLHRRRSVIVRTTADGDQLECIRISNDVDRLSTVMARAREAPEVVLEATQELVLGGRRVANAGKRLFAAAVVVMTGQRASTPEPAVPGLVRLGRKACRA